MSRPRSPDRPKRTLWPEEAEFVVLWLDMGFPLRKVASVMEMSIEHARHFLHGRARKPAARKRLEQRSAFARSGASA